MPTINDLITTKLAAKKAEAAKKVSQHKSSTTDTVRDAQQLKEARRYGVQFIDWAKRAKLEPSSSAATGRNNTFEPVWVLSKPSVDTSIVVVTERGDVCRVVQPNIMFLVPENAQRDLIAQFVVDHRPDVPWLP